MSFTYILPFPTLLFVVAFLYSQGDALDSQRVLLFSYGSGVMASLFSFVGRSVPGGEFTLRRVAVNVSDLFSCCCETRR